MPNKDASISQRLFNLTRHRCSSSPEIPQLCIYALICMVEKISPITFKGESVSWNIKASVGDLSVGGSRPDWAEHNFDYLKFLAN